MSENSQEKTSTHHPILFYDGVCGLCNRFVQFVLRRDPNAIFRFAWLQSALAASTLGRHGADPSDLDTVYVVINYDLPNEHILARSDAILFVLAQLDGRWRVAAFCLQPLPRFLRDAAYHAMASQRYRLFGRSQVCTLPRDHERSRFLGRL